MDTVEWSEGDREHVATSSTAVGAVELREVATQLGSKKRRG